MIVYSNQSPQNEDLQMNATLVSRIAEQVEYYHNTNDNLKYEYALESLMKYMPSGSGIDAGTILKLEESRADRLVFEIGYHHMDENGFYCGWSTRELIVTPSLINEFDMEFINEDASGADFSGIMQDEETGEDIEYDDRDFAMETTGEYLYDVYDHALRQVVEFTINDYKPTVLGIYGELVQ